MKLLFISIAMLFSFAASAQTTDTSKITAKVIVSEKDPQKVTILVSNPYGEKMQIDVISPDYSYLLSKETKANNYQANLDFSAATDGEYTIELTCRNREKFRKTIQMQTRELWERKVALK